MNGNAFPRWLLQLLPRAKTVGAFAILCGLIYAIPTLLYWWETGSLLFFYVAEPDEDFYAALAVTASEPGGWFTNPLILQDPAPTGVGNDALMFLSRGLTAMLTALVGIGPAFGLLNLLFPPLAFFLVCRLVASFTAEWKWQIAAGASVLFLGYYLAPVVFAGKAVLSFLSFDLTWQWLGGATYSRRFNPQVSLPFLLLFLHLHYASVAKLKTSTAIAAGVWGGLLFYCYFFFAVAAAALSGIWAVVAALQGRPHTRIASLTLLVQGLVALPFLTVVLLSSGQYSATFVLRSHAPFLPWPHIGGAIAAVGLLWAPGVELAREARLWLSCLVMAILVVMNQQIVTGIDIEPWHFDSFLLGPLSAIPLSVALASLLQKRPATAMVISAALTGCAFGSGIVGQTRRFVQPFTEVVTYPPVDPVAIGPQLRIVREMVPPNQAVLLGPAILSPGAFVATTERRLYAASYVGTWPTNDAIEYRERGMCYYWFLGLNEPQFLSGPASDARSFVYTAEGFRFWFHPKLLTGEVKRVQAEHFRRIAEAPKVCSKYPVDWILERKGSSFDGERLQQVLAVESRYELGSGLFLTRVKKGD